MEAALSAAAQAATTWGTSSGPARAALLRGLADALEAARTELVPLADAETSLGAARVDGELDRTSLQLRAFADLAAHGAPFATLDDPAVPGSPPAGHPRPTRVQVALGPVAVFAASDSPIACSAWAAWPTPVASRPRVSIHLFTGS